MKRRPKFVPRHIMENLSNISYLRKQVDQISTVTRPGKPVTFVTFAVLECEKKSTMMIMNQVASKNAITLCLDL